MKITIISLDKWGYNNFIAKELISRGIEVNHIDFYKFKYRYPTFFHKVFNFIVKTLFNYNLKREHLNKILLKKIANQEKQDAILIIKGDNLSTSTINTIKKHTDYLVTFLNDSMARYPRMKKVYPLFDAIFSFDPDDVKKHQLNFIPNYIYFDYLKLPPQKTVYNVFNISSLDKRTKTIPQFAQYFKKNNISYKLISYNKNKDESLEKYNVEQITEIYDLEKVFDLVKKSEILLDLQRPNQKGLSFRIFEAIGLKKKIITTNKDIINYDFYNPNNIAVVDSNNIQIPKSFFENPYENVPEEVVKKYHISSWIDKIFNLN